MKNQSSTEQRRPLRRLTQQQSASYRDLYNKFQQLFTSDSSEQLHQDREYFIVSILFLKTFGEFCLGQDEQRQQPSIMNIDLFQPQQNALKQGLVERADFQIISDASFQKLKQFHANPLPRRPIKIGMDIKIPIYLRKYKYLTITSKAISQIEKIIKKKENYCFKYIEESQHATVEQLANSILRKEEMEISNTARMWKVNKDQTIDKFLTHLLRGKEKNNNYLNIKLKGFGKKLDAESKITDLDLEEGDYFIAQIKENDKKWFLTAENERQCCNCYQLGQIKQQCQCKNVVYCSLECREKDKYYHSRRCDFAEMEEFSKKLKLQFTQGSRRGKTGLRNLGNTCFMNSCLQCLSHTLPLTDYFLQRLFQPQINLKNVLGTKGKLARNYAMFIKGMWCDRESVFSPDQIKSSVSNINPIFSGYAQHDSQQFFSFLIDGLHEDLNRVQTKPYVHSVDSNDRADSIVATQSWLAYTKRNQSIITDLMVGQYKSKVTCPTCLKQSVTFDPFITVTLPVSEKPTNSLTCFVFSKNFQSKTKKISFSYGKPNLSDFRKNIARITGLQQDKQSIFLVSMYEGIYCAGRQPLAEIIIKFEQESKNIFVFQMTDEEMNMKDRIDIPARYSKKPYYAGGEYQNLWFKFPLLLQRNSTTGLEIYKKLLKFIYPTAFSRKAKCPNYPSYQTYMLEKRPFKLVFRSGRKIEKGYSKTQYKYMHETQIEDNDLLSNLLDRTNERQCQIDAKFNSQCLEWFQFRNLKDIQQIGDKSKYNTDNRGVELRDCFFNLSQQQQLQKGNQWYCPNCKQHKLATKVIQIYKAPKILILHLKRFKNKGSYRRQKNDTNVSFPLELDMKPFVIDPSPISSYQSIAKQNDIYIPPKYVGEYNIPCSEYPIYELYAVSNHYGGLGGGHYTAYAKNGESWYDFNDSSVRPVDSKDIHGNSAYILFYRRKDQ